MINDSFDSFVNNLRTVPNPHAGSSKVSNLSKTVVKTVIIPVKTVIKTVKTVINVQETLLLAP